MNTGRLIDPFSAPDSPVVAEPTEKECDYCNNPATQAAHDPYDSEINGNYEDQHFCCDNPVCMEMWDDARYQSAQDI